MAGASTPEEDRADIERFLKHMEAWLHALLIGCDGSLLKKAREQLIDTIMEKDKP
jgi:hypothetical protein